MNKAKKPRQLLNLISFLLLVNKVSNVEAVVLPIVFTLIASTFTSSTFNLYSSVKGKNGSLALHPT